jgi:DNA primase
MKEADFRGHIDRLKAAVHGQDVVARIGLPGRGKRFFCPSCQPAGGKTPDLDIFDKGFKCYKCGMTGDVIDLAVMAGGMSKAEAIEYIEQLAGISRPRGSRKRPANSPDRPEKMPLTRSYAAKNQAKAEKTAIMAGKEAADLYDVFLKSVCRPIIATPGAEYLAGRGIEAETADRVGVRYCPDLSGLWKLADSGSIHAAGLSALYVFQLKGLPILVFPYIRRGKPVFIKTRCLLTKEEADQRQVPRFLNSAGQVPCLWNHDAIAGASRVLVCEGEIDALTAIQAGQVGVGLPGWSHWKDIWIRDFIGKDVILVMDNDDAGRKGTRDIAGRFIRAGHPAPLQLVLDEGKDLNEFFLSKREDKGQAT